MNKFSSKKHREIGFNHKHMHLLLYLISRFGLLKIGGGIFRVPILFKRSSLHQRVIINFGKRKNHRPKNKCWVEHLVYCY